MGMLMSTVLKDVVLFRLLNGELWSFVHIRFKVFHRIDTRVPISFLQGQLQVQTV